MEDREFLEGLKDPEGYVRLWHDHGGNLALACYRLASAKLRCAPVSSEVPTEIELYTAACAICRNCHLAMLFSPKSLGDECRAAGKRVL